LDGNLKIVERIVKIINYSFLFNNNYYLILLHTNIKEKKIISYYFYYTHGR
jgi:hypothetical protein